MGHKPEIIFNEIERAGNSGVSIDQLLKNLGKDNTKKDRVWLYTGLKSLDKYHKISRKKEGKSSYSILTLEKK